MDVHGERLRLSGSMAVSCGRCTAVSTTATEKLPTFLGLTCLRMQTGAEFGAHAHRAADVAAAKVP